MSWYLCLNSGFFTVIVRSYPLATLNALNLKISFICRRHRLRQTAFLLTLPLIIIAARQQSKSLAAKRKIKKLSWKIFPRRKTFARSPCLLKWKTRGNIITRSSEPAPCGAAERQPAGRKKSVGAPKNREFFFFFFFSADK